MLFQTISPVNEDLLWGDIVRKKVVFGIIFAILFLLILSIVLYKKPQEEVNKAEAPPTTSNSSLSYIVKDFNGSIAVFENGNENPIKVTEVHTSSLPKADQNMLLNGGIVVKNQSDLSSLLEELCS